MTPSSPTPRGFEPSRPEQPRTSNVNRLGIAAGVTALVIGAAGWLVDRNGPATPAAVEKAAIPIVSRGTVFAGLSEDLPYEREGLWFSYPWPYPKVVDAGGWQLALADEVHGNGMLDLERNPHMGLQIETPWPAHPTLLFSLNGAEWLQWQVGWAGQWVARREFRTWWIQFPGTQNASRWSRLFVRVQGLDGQAVIVLRY